MMCPSVRVFRWAAVCLRSCACLPRPPVLGVLKNMDFFTAVDDREIEREKIAVACGFPVRGVCVRLRPGIVLAPSSGVGCL